MNSVSIDVLLCMLRKSPLEDVYVTGFIDGGTAPGLNFLPLGVGRQFHPMWNDVYLYVGGSLLRLFTSDRDPRLRLSLADRFEYSFEADPDDEYGVVAVLRTLVQSGLDSVCILRVELFVDDACSVEQCVVGAMGLEADGGDYLFFDPLTFDGIHVGGHRSRDLWVGEFGGRYRSVSKLVG